MKFVVHGTIDALVEAEDKTEAEDVLSNALSDMCAINHDDIPDWDSISTLSIRQLPFEEDD